jgi:hypothetical protein
MRFGIGGYAVIEHGSDELSDWQHIKAALPTRRAALAYARREVYTSNTSLLGNLIGGNTDSNFTFLSMRGVYPAATMTVTFKASGDK